jgi:hypothetical protein
MKAQIFLNDRYFRIADILWKHLMSHRFNELTRPIQPHKQAKSQRLAAALYEVNGRAREDTRAGPVFISRCIPQVHGASKMQN